MLLLTETENTGRRRFSFLWKGGGGEFDLDMISLRWLLNIQVGISSRGEVGARDINLGPSVQKWLRTMSLDKITGKWGSIERVQGLGLRAT